MSLTGLAFVCAFFGAVFMAFTRRPIYGLYLYIAIFYLHPPSRWWGETLPDLRWSLFAAVVTMVAIMVKKPPTQRPPWYTTTPAKILMVFTVWFWLQNLWALAPEEHLEASVLFSKYILLFYLIYRLVETPQDIRDFLLVHVGGCLYLGWLAFGIDSAGRLEGVGGPGIGEANAFAMQMGTGAIAAGLIILSERGWPRWACILAAPLILNGIVLAGSRGAFLALVCSGVVIWMIKPREFRKGFYGFAVLGTVLFLMMANQEFWERMGTMEAAVDSPEEMDTSAASRFAIVAAQWEMAKSWPHGAGHRGTAMLSPAYLDPIYLTADPKNPNATPRRSSHNTFMTALVEQGILGAILFVANWLWFWRTVNAQRKRAKREQWSPRDLAQLAALAGAAMMLLAAGMFVDYLKAEVQVWLFALLAARASMVAPEAVKVDKDAPAKAPGRGALVAQRGSGASHSAR